MGSQQDSTMLLILSPPLNPFLYLYTNWCIIIRIEDGYHPKEGSLNFYFILNHPFRKSHRNFPKTVDNNKQCLHLPTIRNAVICLHLNCCGWEEKREILILIGQISGLNERNGKGCGLHLVNHFPTRTKAWKLMIGLFELWIANECVDWDGFWNIEPFHNFIYRILSIRSFVHLNENN